MGILEKRNTQNSKVEERHIGGLAVRDRHKRRDGAAQVEQGVELHRSLVPAGAGPREQREAQIDRCRIEGVGRLCQVHRGGLGGVQGTRPGDQGLREVAVDPPVARLVRVGQGAPRDPAPEPHVVQLRLEGAQTRLDIAEALLVGELGERQAEELIVTGECAESALAGVAGGGPLEGPPRNQNYELREHGAARIQWPVHSASRTREATGQSVRACSSRYHPLSRVTPCLCLFSRSGLGP